jgi:hypothetical protein
MDLQGDNLPRDTGHLQGARAILKVMEVEGLQGYLLASILRFIIGLWLLTLTIVAK